MAIQKLTIFVPMLLLFLGEMALGAEKPKKVDSLLAKFVNPENVVKQEATEQGGVQLKTLNNSMWERTSDNAVVHLDRQGKLTKNVKAKSLLESGSGEGKPKKVDSLLMNAPSEGKPKKVDSLLAQFVSPENVVKQEATEQGGVQLKTLNNSMWERTSDNAVVHLDRQGKLTKNVKAKSLLVDQSDGVKPKKVHSLLARYVDPADIVKQEETEEGGIQVTTKNKSMWEVTPQKVVAHVNRQGKLTKEKVSSILPPKIPRSPSMAKSIMGERAPGNTSSNTQYLKVDKKIWSENELASRGITAFIDETIFPELGKLDLDVDEKNEHYLVPGQREVDEKGVQKFRVYTLEEIRARNEAKKKGQAK